VSVVPVLRQDMPIILTGLGTMQAYNTVTLKTRVDGEIMTVYFRDGQEVTKARAAKMPSSTPASCASVPS
jgi:multidrug efflux system membrane fusion protein